MRKMIDKITEFLTNKIRKEMPDVDDERAEVINYGLQNIVGEIPKIFIMLGISYCLGIFNLSLFTFISLIIYNAFYRICIRTIKIKFNYIFNNYAV